MLLGQEWKLGNNSYSKSDKRSNIIMSYWDAMCSINTYEVPKRSTMLKKCPAQGTTHKYE